MKLVKDVMTRVEKCLNAKSTLFEAINMMRQSRWNIIPVVNSSGKLIGVFTRNSLYNMILSNLSFETPIGHFIKKDIGTVLEDANVAEINNVIANSKVGNGIVINKEGKPVGIFTTTDAVMNFLDEANTLKEQLEKILLSSNLGAIMTNEKKQIIFVNQRIITLLGEKPDNLLYKQLDTLLPESKDIDFEKEIHFRKQIKEDFFIVRLSKYNKAEGKSGFIVLFQDVSELESMAQELETIKKWKSILQTVIHNAYDGLVMINDKEEVIFISPSLIELFGLHNIDGEKAKVDEILPHFELSQVFKTGVAEFSNFMEIKGINYIVQKIPVYQDDVMIGAIGKVLYRQLHEVRERFRTIEDNEKQLKNASKKIEYSRFTFDEIISIDDQMEKLKRSAIKAAKGKSTILIRGESGTGKELFAHAVHSASSIEKGPFITVNCAAIPEHLLESEFFGYDEGAFTGAKHKGKIGKFDMANGGTLFLDEVGDMSSHLQAKLLRVLQERGFYRVGGTERVEVNVRIIAATNQPLEKMVEEGTFREDLFYRLNVISFEIPPLRKRKKDILLISEHFIKDLNKQNGTSITGWEPMVEQALLNYEWPGNIRELRNVWERAMVFAESGKVQLEDLPDYLLSKIGYDLLEIDDNELQEQPLLEKAEQLAIQKALQLSNGNKSVASKILGISRSVLYEKLKKYKNIIQ